MVTIMNERFCGSEKPKLCLNYEPNWEDTFMCIPTTQYFVKFWPFREQACTFPDRTWDWLKKQ